MLTLLPVLLLTVNISFFLAWILLLALLHDPKFFVLVCILILLFQIPSSISKTFLALALLLLLHLFFLLSLFPLFLCFLSFFGLLHTKVDILPFLLLPSPNQFQGYVLLTRAFLKLSLSFPDYTHLSSFIPYALYNINYTLSHVFSYCCLFCLYFWFEWVLLISLLWIPISPQISYLWIALLFYCLIVL